MLDMESWKKSGESRMRPAGRGQAAFLLAQVGAHAASRFGERLKKLKLIPAHAGIMRILGARQGMTQQALAETLGMFPSRLVALLDELESRGLIERRASQEDRRRYALHLTEEGNSMLVNIGLVAREHQQALLAALSQDEQGQLADLLQRVADEQALTRGVHPGYARIR